MLHIHPSRLRPLKRGRPAGCASASAPSSATILALFRRLLLQLKELFAKLASILSFHSTLKLRALPADTEGMEERRTEVRMLCADIVEVSWQERSGRKRQATGVLEDISAS